MALLEIFREQYYFMEFLMRGLGVENSARLFRNRISINSGKQLGFEVDPLILVVSSDLTSKWGVVVLRRFCEVVSRQFFINSESREE